MYTDPTVADFKNYFDRDFPYSDDIALGVTDNDITKAQDQTRLIINPDLFCKQEEYTYGFELLSAHLLVLNIRQSSQGLSGQFEWVQSSKSVGSVSEGLSIPPRILENPDFAILAKTNYGAQYLFFILPRIAGQMFTVLGRTHA